MLGESEFGIKSTKVEKSDSNLFDVGRRKRGLLAFCSKMGKSIVIELIGIFFCSPERLTRFGRVVQLLFSVCVFSKRTNELMFVFTKGVFSLSCVLDGVVAFGLARALLKID